MGKQLVIVGTSEFAHIAYEYFSDDSDYEVVAFAVESEYLTQESLYGLPVVAFETMEKHYPPAEYKTFVALTYGKLNRTRRRLYHACKEKGYTCASYVSSHSFFWKNAEIGENSFVFEDNTVQYHVKIGNNVILWSGNHIGHSTVIHDDVWLASHVVVSGMCEIDKGCFLGVNATLGNGVYIAEDVVLGAGAVAVKNLEEKAGVYVGNPARLLPGRNSYQQFGVEDHEI